MSKFTDFYGHITADQKAKERLEALAGKFTDDTQLDSVVEELVAFAKEEGFDFTTEEVKEYVASAGHDGQLSDDELEAVAGGKASGGCFIAGRKPNGELCVVYGTYQDDIEGGCIIIGVYL